VAAKTRPALTGPARDGCEGWRSGRKNARGAGRTKEWNQEKTARDTDIQSAAPTISSAPPTLDRNTISSTTSKRQSDAHSHMITIPGTGDHDHLEYVITIRWND
jgi:hypothetical protein